VDTQSQTLDVRVEADDPIAAVANSSAPAVATSPDLIELRRGPRVGAGRRGGRSRWLLRLLVPALLVAAWQIGSSTGHISTRMLASPSQVISATRFLIHNGDLQSALPISIKRALTGLAFGVPIGVLFGIGAGLSRLGEELIDSSLQMLRTIPFIALVPLFIMWFGIGEEAKIVFVAVACVFPAYLNTYAGIRNVDRKVIEAGRVFGLGRVKLVTKIILPNALPSVLVGVRYAMGVALLALVAAEQINATSGLGFLIMTASSEIRTDIVIVGVLMYALLGLSVDLVVRLAEKLLLPWRPTILGQ
jgi:sulfonate transport system permease protein